MLHKESVNEKTLGLINSLQNDLFLKGFILVGGTGLTLQIGHRMSVDIDFFTRKEFDTTELRGYLEKEYFFEEQYQHKNTLKGLINGVFVDFIRHDYPDIDNPVETGGMIISS